MKTLIKNGRLVDPSSDRDGAFDLLIKDDHIEAVEGQGKIDSSADFKIDAKGKIVSPGFIDLHVHFREPGFTHKEDLKSGARAAVAGGFTTVCCMANTKPVLDTPELLTWILTRSREIGLANILPIAALTVGQKGERETNFDALAKAGAVAFSDDGGTVMNRELMKHAMLKAKDLGLPIIEHCEDQDLVAGGVMNDGVVSLKLGLKGNTRKAEIDLLKRDLELAEETGAKFHVAHLTTKEGVKLVREAKEKGLNVTAEVTPHHLTLTENKIAEFPFDTNYKIGPPLRTAADVEALRNGVRDGVIDFFATDHAPHQRDEKELPFSQAPFGVIGLETALPIYLSLVEDGVISMSRCISLLTFGPAKFLEKNIGTLKKGSQADITIFDPECTYTIDVENGFSKGRNCPFHGLRVKGKVTDVFVKGRHIFKEVVLQ